MSNPRKNTSAPANCRYSVAIQPPLCSETVRGPTTQFYDSSAGFAAWSGSRAIMPPAEVLLLLPGRSGPRQVLDVAARVAFCLFAQLPGPPLGLLQRRVSGNHYLPEERHRHHLEAFLCHPAPVLTPFHSAC